MTEPEQRRTALDGSKYYDHPTRTQEDGSPAQYTSVTTVMSAVSKQALVPWAAKGSAQRAMENLPALIKAARLEPCGRTYHREGRCEQCAACLTRWVSNWHFSTSNRRKTEGSEFHRVRAWWIHHDGEVIPHDPPIAPYVQRFLEFIRDYGLTPASFIANEMTVWNHTHRYAGTLDSILRVEPVTEPAARFCARLGKPDDAVEVVVDDKTREGPGKQFYLDMPLQIVAYRRAETATNKLEMIEHQMPAVDGGAIFQPRPDGYSFEPVMCGPAEFDAFLGFLAGYRWTSERGSKAINVSSFPVPDGWAWKGTGDRPRLAVVTTPAPEGASMGATARKTTGKPAKTTRASSVASATLESVAKTGGHSRARGATLNDDGIPF